MNTNVRPLDTESESANATKETDSEDHEDHKMNNEHPELYDHVLSNINIRTPDTKTTSSHSASIPHSSTIHHKMHKQKKRTNYISQEDLDREVKKVYVLMEIYCDRCAMVHSGCEDMNAQDLCNHLTYLHDMIKINSFIFKQCRDAKEFVLETIDEYWDWYFY